jgi:protein-L-isoaspartate(D-aspartate) O-methyltransferase
MSVMEIGTGTGWNAAIMAAAGARVTTIEIDQGIADHARSALRDSGYPTVRVICGDGELGVPGQAPYDRIIATASVHTVPYAWVSQTAEGGRIVLPYSGQHHRSGLAVLTVRNGVAVGDVINDEAWFMPMKGQGISQEQLRQAPQPYVRIEVRPDGQKVVPQPYKLS